MLLKMGKNCNLELRLLPPSHYYDDPHRHHRDLEKERQEKLQLQLQRQQQLMTIFYNGRVSVCDVTELQARAIMMLASGKMEEKKTPTNSSPAEASSSPPPPLNLSMKRSLQRFLHKRKDRIQSTSPYHR